MTKAKTLEEKVLTYLSNETDVRQVMIADYFVDVR